MVSVIVAGSTGAIGRAVVQHAIRQSSITRVVALTRSSNITPEKYEEAFGVVTSATAAENATATHDGGDGHTHTKPHHHHHHHHRPDVTVVSPSQAAKIEPVTIDWEAFTDFWATANTTAPASAASPEATDAALNMYKELFSGHTYAAMCLGTTRSDAGSAEKFVRVDYDYVIAFTEAVLAFSAPAGLHPNASFVHHIGDGGEVKKNALEAADTHHSTGKAAATADPATTAAAADVPQAVGAVAKTTGTLRGFCQVSASGADSGSMFLYMRTKGNADEATVERVHQHNTAAAVGGGVLPPVVLSLLRPGLLQRHGKTRFNEKMAKLVVSAMPVETCAAAAVASFVEPKIREAICRSAQLTAEGQQVQQQQQQQQAEEEEGLKKIPLGSQYTATKKMKKAGVPSKEKFACVYELSNAAIKQWAAYLPAETDPVAIGAM